LIELIAVFPSGRHVYHGPCPSGSRALSICPQFDGRHRVQNIARFLCLIGLGQGDMIRVDRRVELEEITGQDFVLEGADELQFAEATGANSRDP
jgi:hypothetical protein